MKKFLWILSCAVLAVCLLFILPTEAHAAEIVDSGTCGENMTWVLDDAGTLTISGSGDMTNYSSGWAPWYGNRDAIMNVVIESGVSSIGGSAFYNCTGLTEITIPDSVTSIGGYAFYNCTGLTSITLPDSVTSIGNYAFYGCTGLKGIWVDGENPNYSNDAYGVLFNKNKTELIRVPGALAGEYFIPDSVTGIGAYAFGGCSGLTSITIPDSVTSVGRSAFSGCTGLITVKFNATNCTTMGSQSSPVFSGCTNLTTINIGDDVTAIPAYAFSDCFSLKCITIPDSVISIGVSAFSGCSSLTGIWVHESNPSYSSDTRGVLFSKDKATLIQIPGAISGSYTIPDTVQNIGAYAFGGCRGLTSITIPDSVTSIGSSAFSGCTGLTSITIPDSVTSIGSSAFSGCTGLTSITIPDSTTSVGSYAFYDCPNLSSIYITDIAAWCRIGFADSLANPLSYAENLYVDNQLVTELIIPNSVTSIGRYAFYGYSRLISVAVADSVTSVGNSAFRGCSGLTSITIPDSVTSIGSSAFRGCSGLTSITIPDSVTSVGSYAFYDCFSLKCITIPDSVISIGVSAFSGCSSLESMTIPFVGECRKSNTDTYQYPLGYFFGTASYTGGAATTQYYHGSSTYSTTYDTYYVPTSLKTVTVTGGDIPYGAFYNCTNLTSVTIGDSVTHIGSSAFYGCSSLESMTVPFIGECRKTYLNTYQYPLGYFFGTASYTGGVATTQHYYGTYSSSFTTSSTYYIPASLKNVTVRGGNILYGAFYGCKNLTSITIEDGVTSIRESAFYTCKNLKTIHISAGITTLSSSTFSGCSNVEFMVLPESLAQINSEKDFFDIFTNEDFILGVAPGSYAESLAIQYSKLYKYVFDGFSFAKEPTKKIYFTDEELSLDGMVVLHGDGIGEAKEITDYSVTGYDSEPGIKTITVSYQGYSVAFTVVVVDKNDFISGRGYKEDPVLIYDVDDLLTMETVNQKYGYPFYYRLAINITLPDNWKPICDATSPFVGTLDGNGFTITNLTTDSAAPSRTIGLFHTNNGIITNLAVADVDVHATYLAGSVNVGCIAVNNNGTIRNCSAVGEINILMDDKSSYGSTSNACVGGIAAYNSGTITGCRNEVDIVATSDPSTGGSSSVFKEIYATIYAGGVVGNSSGGTLIYNENYGDISATTSMGTSGTTDTVYELNAHAGGIAAYSHGSIQQCRNFGNVSSGLGKTGVAQSRINTAVYAGGIVGDGGPCTICYNTGNVSSNGHTFVVYRESVNDSWKFYARGKCYFGGIAGNGSASTCYSVGKVTECGPTDNSGYIQTGDFLKSGGICGSGSASACYSGTDDSMKQQSTYVGFDFDTIWRMPTAGEYVYPVLQCFADKLDSIFVSTLPEKLTYLDSQETLDLTGGMLTLVYGDGRTQTIQITSDMVLGFDNKIIGTQSLCIQYLGRTTSFEVEVIAPTIVFADYDGTIISSKTYRYGETITPPDAPTRSSDNTYTYTFAGWDKEVTICQGNATYTATYDAEYIEYTVEFRNWGGTVISRTNYHYGDAILAPTNVGRPADNIYSYKFIGWDQNATVCHGNAVYTAVYQKSFVKYTVTFQNYDGSVISSKVYHYGDTVIAPADPTKVADNTYAYTFKGWDKAVTNCAGNATYTATYTSTYINYTVVFKDWNGTVLSTKAYHFGDIVTVPANPSRPGDDSYIYTFTGWDKTVVACNGDTTYTAVYSYNYVPVGDGWKWENGAWRYYQGGAKQTAWQNIGGVWYFFHDDGAMHTGWLQLGSIWYYMKDNGAMAYGETLNIGGTYYSFDASGVWIIPVAKDGWEWENGAWRYYQGGAKQTAWQNIGGVWYFFHDDGDMHTGWLQLGSVWYYMKDNGAMAYGETLNIGGTYYSFDASGVWYVPVAKDGWEWENGTWYYYQGGAKQTGWKFVGNAWYYLDSSGAMQTGWQYVGGVWYYMNSSGTMQTGWLDLDGTWYYLNDSGAMQTGWQYINGTWYFLNASGVWIP